jgi:F-type H+-transporting ATPase subunit epsilon
VPVENLDAAQIDKEIKAAEEDLADAKSDEARTKASAKLDQLRSVKAILGSSAAVH